MGNTIMYPKTGTKKKVLLYDTTLRDGMQGENIFFSPEDKVKIAKRLDD